MSNSMFDDDFQAVSNDRGINGGSADDSDKKEDKGRRRGNNENPSADLVRVYLNGIGKTALLTACLLYTSPSPRDRTRSRMPSSA